MNPAAAQPDESKSPPEQGGGVRGPAPAGSPLIGSSGDTVAEILKLGLSGERAVAIPRPAPQANGVTAGFRPVELLPAFDHALCWIMGREVSVVLLLERETTTLRDLRLVKQVAKRLCAGAHSRPWRGLTRALYFAAIAAAYAHREAIITKKPLPDLTYVLGLLVRSPCLPIDLRDVVRDAHDGLLLRA
ncbi:MAG: hypothetical protein ACF8NJ_08115 [Phycisphaerales bacterium JB038]